MLTDSNFHEPALPFAATLDQIERGIIQPGGLAVRDLFTAIALHAMLTKWMPYYDAGEDAAIDVLEEAGELAVIAGNAVMRTRGEEIPTT